MRPYISYRWQSAVGVSGLFSSGEAKGGIDAAAFLNGRLIDGVRRSELFSDSLSSGVRTPFNSDEETVWVPDVTLGFRIEASQVEVVNFGAWVEADHSNEIGVGAGAGMVQATVPWIVAEYFPGA